MILPNDKLQAINTLKEVIKMLEALPEKKSCETCVYCEHKHCSINDYKEIPPHIIDNGCEAWVYDITQPPF